MVVHLIRTCDSRQLILWGFSILNCKRSGTGLVIDGSWKVINCSLLPSTKLHHWTAKFERSNFERLWSSWDILKSCLFNYGAKKLNSLCKYRPCNLVDTSINVAGYLSVNLLCSLFLGAAIGKAKCSNISVAFDRYRQKRCCELCSQSEWGEILLTYVLYYSRLVNWSMELCALCPLVNREMNKPSTHRLPELYRNSSSLSGQAVFICNMTFETNHQPLKGTTTKHKHSEAHNSGAENMLGRHWVQRIADTWKLGQCSSIQVSNLPKPGMPNLYRETKVVK